MRAYKAIEYPEAKLGDYRGESQMSYLFVKSIPEFPIVVGADPNFSFGERLHVTVHHYDVALLAEAVGTVALQ